ncbi:MAG: hypothetical protein WA324_24510 [Bryobacteraceae bacterium]
MTREEPKAHIPGHENDRALQNDGDLENNSDSQEEIEPRTDENSPVNCEPEDEQSPAHPSTGPRTPAGKAISSQNATKHGCRSQKLILRHEDPAEYEALHQKWWDQYQPADHTAETLVTQLINNHWLLLRNSKRLEDVEWNMPEDPFEWQDEHHKMLHTFTRYKTAAERAFHKAFRTVETHIRHCARDKISMEKADLLRRKIEAGMARKVAATTPPPATPQPHRPSSEELSARWKAETAEFASASRTMPKSTRELFRRCADPPAGDAGTHRPPLD